MAELPWPRRAPGAVTRVTLHVDPQMRKHQRGLCSAAEVWERVSLRAEWWYTRWINVETCNQMASVIGRFTVNIKALVLEPRE